MEVTQKRPARGNLGKMSSTRQGTFVIAAVATIIAAAILLFALSRYRHSVESANKPATVIVASRFIEQGTAGSVIGVGQYAHSLQVTNKRVATGALVNTSALQGEVAAHDIYPGQQLRASDFVSGGLFYSKLPAGRRAVSIPLDTAHGLVGDVHNGDRVDAYVSFPKEPNREAFVRLVAPDVVVLDAGQLASSGGLGGGTDQTRSESDVALEVTTHQAAELAYATDNGKVWLVLRPAHAAPPSSEVIDTNTFLSGPQAAASGESK
jgi:Flp pilus assembly protein CpaB